MTSVIVGANGKNVEPDALNEWKINIFKIIYTRIISFYTFISP